MKFPTRPTRYDVATSVSLRLKRALGLADAPPLESGQVVQPVFPLVNRGSVVPEPMPLGSWAKAFTSSAGNNASAGLGNPKNSGRVILLTQLSISTNVAAQWQLNFSSGYTSIGTQTPGSVAIDRSGVFKRRGVVGETFSVDTVSGVPTTTGGAVGNGAIIADRTVAGSPRDWFGTEDDPILALWPDEYCFAIAFSAAVNLITTWFWTEVSIPSDVK